jgi:hypothetical protein
MTVTASATASRHGLPGQLLIEEVVRRQDRVAPRTRRERLLGRSPISAKNLPWYVGAKGELVVGRILDRLSGEWRVLHSLPVSHASDVDHVVIGRAGVFVLNTKHHAGKRVWAAGRSVLVDGQRLPYIPKAEREGTRVSDALTRAGVFGTEVQPVLVLVSVASLTLRAEPDVPIVRAEQLLSWLRAQPAKMDEEVVAELAMRLRRPGIWADHETQVPDARARFTAIDAEVARAALVRRLWALGGAVASLGVSYSVVTTALRVLGGGF